MLRVTVVNRFSLTVNGVVVIGYLFKATVDFFNTTNEARDYPPNCTIVQYLTITVSVSHLFDHRSFFQSYLSVVIVRPFLCGMSHCVQRM